MTGTSLTPPPVKVRDPAAGKSFHLSGEISQHLPNGLAQTFHVLQTMYLLTLVIL